MPNNVDNRIVDMQFNNRQFESGIKTSLKSLDDLKKGLQLEESAKSLTNLNKAGRAFSLAGIADGVDMISKRFTALGIMGTTVLVNLANSAVNMGKRIVSALTIDPISTGLEEYETKMNAITTILTNTQSKGTTLDDVNKALNELNQYADLTIYNFAEMTRNIGTFTAAGVDLKTSTTSIKGIANLAAGSGSSAQQASTAMYQLSQAIASGTVKLMDWNSVVNAGMGGELFQKALEKTAVELGHGRNMAVSFRESLESGWITTEVLTKTLEKFANDKSLIKAATQVKTFTQLVSTMKESVQSGWAQTWELIIGNREEAANFFTAINDGFSASAGAAANARNEMLAYWKANGGRAALIQGMSNALIGLASVLEPIEAAFKDIFPAITEQRLVELTKKFKDITANFKIGDETANNLKRTFKGLFAVTDIGVQFLTAFAKGLFSVVKYLAPVGDGFLGVTANIGDFLVALDKSLKSSNTFTKIIENIGIVLKPFANGIRTAITIIINAFKALGNIDLTGADKVSTVVEKRFQPITKTMEFFAKIWNALLPGFYKLVDGISNGFLKLTSGIGDAFANADYQKGFDLLNSGLFAGALLGLNKFFKSLTDISNNAGGFLKNITGILDGVKGSLEAYQSNLKAGTLLKIAGAIGILAAALLVLSTIDSQKLTVAMAAMTGMFIELFGAMAIFGNVMSKSGIKTMATITIATTAMIALSGAVLILSFAMAKLAKLDWNGIAKGLVAVGVLMGELIITTKYLNTGKGLVSTSLGLILFAEAINIMAAAVKKLSEIPFTSLTKGLIGMGVLLAELAFFMNKTDLGGMGIRSGLGLIAMAAALNILASAVEKFGKMGWKEIVKGLGAVGAILIELNLFINKTGNPKGMISTAIGLTILGAALNIFASAIGKLGQMSWEGLGKGLISIGVALGVIALAMNKMPNNMISSSVGLLAISSAMTILSKAMATLGQMSWTGLAKGVLTLAISLGTIATAMKFMTTALPGAAALVIISIGLGMLVGVLKTLALMPIGDIAKGLLALITTLAIFGASAVLLGPVIPLMLGLGGAVALLGAGCLAAGAGILALSAGLAALAVSGAAGIAVMIGAIKALIELVPAIAISFAKGIIEFAKVIGNGAPIVADSFVKVMKAIIKTIVELTPEIMKGATTLILGFLQVIIDTTPKIVQAIMTILKQLLKAIVDFVPTIVKAGFDIIVGFIKGIADAIPKVVSAAVDVVVAFLRAIGKETPRIIDAGFKMVIDLINGIANSIRENTPLITDALFNLAGAMIDAMAELPKRFLEIGGQIIQGLIDGIKDAAKGAVQAVSDTANNMVNAVKEKLGIHSPSRVFKEIGEYMNQGLAKGIEQSTPQPVAATKKAATAVVKASKETFDTFKTWLDDRKYYNEISLADELAAWQGSLTKYKLTAEQRKEVDREIYRVKKELREKDLQAEKDAFDKSSNWISEQKNYNKLALTEELAAWKRVQARYLEGTDERKKADYEVYRVQKEINDTNVEYSKRVLELEKNTMETKKQLEQDYYDKTKEINNQLIADIKSVTDEYENAVKSRTDALYSTYGLFDEVSKSDPVSGVDLTKNLKDQVDEFNSWQANISALAKKGIDQGLIKELTDMGPKSNAQITALNTMTAEELTTYVSLWQQKHNQAKTEALSELESLRIETDNKIEQLKIDAAKQLAEYGVIWAQKLRDLKKTSNDELDTLKNEWSSKIGELRGDTENQFVTLVNNVKTVINQSDWVSVGSAILNGIKQGVQQKQSELNATVQKVAQGALNTMKATLGIYSPSREFAKLGEYSMQGFANGLTDFSSVVETTATDIGNNALTALRTTLANISSVINSDMDAAPVIRPVLDLTDVKKGTDEINGLFGKSQGLDTSGIAAKVPKVGNSNSSDGVNQTTTQTNTPASIQFTQNNYSPKPLSRLDIYRQTNNQIKTLEGLVNPI